MKRTIFCCLFILCAGSGTAAFGGGKGNNNPGSNVWEQLEDLRAQIEALTPIPASAAISVDCDAGESINDALATRADALEIDFTGTCYEDLLIDRQKVSLSGSPGGVVEGSIRVAGSVLTALTDVTIVNSTNDGLHVGDASVNAVRLHVSGAGGSGMLVFGGSLLCADCSSNSNGVDGLLVTSRGRAVLGGDCEFNGNGAEGLEAGYGSALGTVGDSTLIGASAAPSDIDVIGNAGFNVLIYGASSFSTTPDDHVSASQGSFGILVASGGTAHLNGDYEIYNNSTFGLASLGGTIRNGATIDIEGSAFGLFVDDHGTVRGGGAIDASDNGTGLFVRSSYFGDVALTINNTNSAATLLLGAVVNVPNAQITGNVGCDGTEIIQGPFACGLNP